MLYFAVMCDGFRCFIFIVILGIATPLAAQDSVLAASLIQRIASMQITHDAPFTRGNFPTYITNKPRFKKGVKDDNVFFASLIQYTLQQYTGYLPEHSRNAVDTIRQRSSYLYPKFKNTKGRLTYNFWRTDTAFVFPYTRWIRKLKKNTALPDDMDDTVLSLLAQNTDSAAAAAAHAVMQDYTSHSNKAKSIPKHYREWNAYSVWYGKKFPPVIDICVLSNVLLFVQTYNLAWTAADSASLQVIVEAVESGDYIKKPLLVSPYYGSTSVVLYHLARLMSVKKIPQLEALTTKLLVESVRQFSQTDDLLEKVILASAIFKWGYVPPRIVLPVAGETIRTIEQSNLPFFVGNVPSYFPSFSKNLFTQKEWLIFYHYCPSFNDALLLEYVLLIAQAQQ